MTCGVSMPTSSAGPSAQRGERGGEPLVEAAAALRHDLEAGRQPRAGLAVEHQHPPPRPGSRSHGVQGVGERGLGELGRLVRGARRA